MALIVLDTSAVVAILLDEPERARFRNVIELADRCLVSAVSRAEMSLVMEGRKAGAGRAGLEALLRIIGVEVVAVTPDQAEVAITAFRRYGRGHHAARLNLGDCFSYALAKSTDLPLLFKGDDFTHTDIVAAA